MATSIRSPTLLCIIGLLTASSPVLAQTAKEGPEPTTPELPTPPAPIRMTVFTRLGLRLQNPLDPKKLNDVSVDTADILPGFSGNIYEHVNWSASFYGAAQTNSSGLPAGGTVSVLGSDRAV